MTKKKRGGKSSIEEIKKRRVKQLVKKYKQKKTEDPEGIKILKTYNYNSKNIPITINIMRKKGEYMT